MNQNRTILAIVLSIVAASALPAQATTLSDLISGGSITVGNLAFSGFSYLPLGDMPADPSAIVVTTVDTPAGDIGLTFTGAFKDLPGGFGGSGANIDYHVAIVGSGAILSASLAGVPALSGMGSVTVTEKLSQNGPLEISAITGSPSQTVDGLTFSPSTESLNVQVGVLALTMGNSASVPSITTTFTSNGIPTPEPSTGLLLAVALVGLGGRTLLARLRK